VKGEKERGREGEREGRRERFKRGGKVRCQFNWVTVWLLDRFSWRM
jgi:hypothetical protein